MVPQQLSELRREAQHRLLKAPLGLEDRTAQLEVDMLLEHVLGITRTELLTGRASIVAAEQRTLFESLLVRRERGEPIAYLLGEREFFSLPFKVSPSVLIPRPETELLVELALPYFERQPVSFVVVDVCTGSGAVVLALAHELRRRFGEAYLGGGIFVGSDISDAALTVAAENARLLELHQVVRFVRADLLTAFHPRICRAELALVLANPPYIPDAAELPRDVATFEPALALRGGRDGLDVITRLIQQAPLLLQEAETASLLFELGDGQRPGVDSLLRSAEAATVFDSIKFHSDLAGIPRVVEVSC
ncbi:MAG: peptide chain release factor N(5)-glutamine methyltransferase [Bdellovibrionales bacterium]|nr:peptide chain release factor N(5)-glutamine methyltransferase [Bdellovibrionales bacterium]